MSNDGQVWLFDPAETLQPIQTRDGSGPVVREICCKSLLNTSSIGDYSFNCYVGCEHACGYCYARYMQRFHPHTEAWGRFVDVKVNAVQVLARQLRILPTGSVFTCSACDGWQPIEEHYRLTRECCRLLLAAGFSLTILTKNRLVLRDLDIFSGHEICLGVTITTPDEDWAKIWEPAASPVADRWEILRQAKAAGLRTAVMFGPLLPGISDTEDALRRLYKQAAEVCVNHVWTDILNRRSCVWPAIQEVVRHHCPDLYEQYRRLLFDTAWRRRYRREVKARIGRIAAACRKSKRPPPSDSWRR